MEQSKQFIIKVGKLKKTVNMASLKISKSTYYKIMGVNYNGQKFGKLNPDQVDELRGALNELDKDVNDLRDEL